MDGEGRAYTHLCVRSPVGGVFHRLCPRVLAEDSSAHCRRCTLRRMYARPSGDTELRNASPGPEVGRFRTFGGEGDAPAAGPTRGSATGRARPLQAPRPAGSRATVQPGCIACSEAPSPRPRREGKDARETHQTVTAQPDGPCSAHGRPPTPWPRSSCGQRPRRRRGGRRVRSRLPSRCGRCR